MESNGENVDNISCVEVSMRMLSLGFAAALILSGCNFALAAGDLGKGGASCTYEVCMKRCIENSGKLCSAYCEKTLKERKASGVCK
ncbi:MAG: hypothetical protein NTZ72_19715 [Afipia sp.]|nr:hypothetical protein [Afipia sp.]